MVNSTVKSHYQDAGIARSYDRERFSNLPGRALDMLEKRALRAVLRIVRGHISSPRTLDCPCGTGRITELWLSEGLEVTAGDISDAMIEVAREKCAIFGGRVDFQLLDLHGLDLDEGCFDLVSCIRLFHHLDSDERARILRELARVSSRFVLINASYSSRYYRWRRRLKRFLKQGVSQTSSTWLEIQSEAAQAGLRVAETRFVLPGVSEDLVVLLEKCQ